AVSAVSRSNASCPRRSTERRNSPSPATGSPTDSRCRRAISRPTERFLLSAKKKPAQRPAYVMMTVRGHVILASWTAASPTLRGAWGMGGTTVLALTRRSPNGCTLPEEICGNIFIGGPLRQRNGGGCHDVSDETGAGRRPHGDGGPSGRHAAQAVAAWI